MVDQGYQTFAVVFTSILIAIIILLLIIMFLDTIINENEIYKDSNFFCKLIWHCDIFGRLFGTRNSIIIPKEVDMPKSKGGSNSEMFGGCGGSCNNFNLSSSLTYDPQIFLQKRKH